MVLLDLPLRHRRSVSSVIAACSPLASLSNLTPFKPDTHRAVMSANSVDTFLQGRHERAMIRLCALLWILKLEEDCMLHCQESSSANATSSRESVRHCSEQSCHDHHRLQPTSTYSGRNGCSQQVNDEQEICC